MIYYLSEDDDGDGSNGVRIPIQVAIVNTTRESDEQFVEYQIQTFSRDQTHHYMPLFSTLINRLPLNRPPFLADVNMS